MNDHAKNLRRWADAFDEVSTKRIDEAADRMEEMADEVERLRDLLDRIDGIADPETHTHHPPMAAIRDVLEGTDE